MKYNRVKFAIANKVRSIIPSLQVDVIISVVFLLIILIILGTNLWRKIEDGRRDYAVYVEEQAALDKLRSENALLKAELNYYSSIEYKLLYARDSLNKVRSGEKLYELSNDVIIYNYAPEPVKLYSKLEPLEVWRRLLFDAPMW
jgi:cell division protein FtsB